MALDNNHITKLGELKQLIDGLWGKVTTAISNAVSGLLSKSEAAKTYATKGEIPPEYVLTAAKVNAVGNITNNTSGKAATAGSVSPQSDYGGYLEIVPTANTLDVFRGNCDVDGSLLSAIKSKVNSPILENSDNRSATFFGRLNLNSNATLKSLLGTGTYPFYFVSISRQAGFVIISSGSSLNNIFGSITGQKPSIGYLRNLIHAAVNTSIGSATQPVYFNASGNAVSCNKMPSIVYGSLPSTLADNTLYLV